jgi:trimethylamine--corrinoid protein Co-methyltransferase
LAGANLIYGAGMLESGVTMDFGQLVLDAELARLIKHSVAGIPVSDETLAVEDIEAVGFRDDFLSLPSTYAHMREQSQPRLLDRRVRAEWAADGSTRAEDRALARAREILARHEPLPLPEGVPERFAQIIAAAADDLGVTP